MKKLLIGTIVLATIVATFFAIMLTKCGTWGKINELKAKDWVTGEIISIPLSFQYGIQTETTAAASNADITEIKKQIENLSSAGNRYNATLFHNNQLLIEIFTGNKRKSMMLLSRQNNTNLDSPHKNLNYAYLFTDLSATITETNTKIILPYPFLQEENLGYGGNWVSKNKLYYTDHSINDFASFYKKAEECYQPSNQPCFELKGNEIILNAPLVLARKNTPGTSASIILKFSSIDAKNYFIITTADESQK